MATHTRRLIDTGAFTPQSATAVERTECRPARPVVQILGIRYLAARPLEDIRCLARTTRTRARCTQPLPDPEHPTGIWRLLPATATTGQLALPADLVMTVYDLSALPWSEQLRWRAQHCPHHSFAAAEMAPADWEPFDSSSTTSTSTPACPTRSARYARTAPAPRLNTRPAPRPGDRCAHPD